MTPSPWAPGSTQVIEMAGSNFATWGITVTVRGTGVTVTRVSRVSATLLRTIVTVAANAPTGGRSIAVRNGDQGVARSPVLVVWSLSWVE